MSARVPPTAIALAGVKLDQLRASPLYAKLPAAATAFLEPFREARSLLVATTGAEVLTIAGGSVRGATRAAPDPALAGAPALIAAANVPHARAAILGAAETVAADHPIWLAVRGAIPLPLEGNLANLNNLVRLTHYLTVSARLSDAAGQGVELELTAQCPSPGAATEFERRLRAMLSLAAAANARQPAIAAMLASLQLRREQQTVRATLRAAPDTLGKLLF